MAMWFAGRSLKMLAFVCNCRVVCWAVRFFSLRSRAIPGWCARRFCSRIWRLWALFTSRSIRRMGHNATLATTCLTSPRGCSLPPERPNRRTRTLTMGAEANQRAAKVRIGVDGIFTRAHRNQSLNDSMTMRHFLGTDPFSKFIPIQLEEVRHSAMAVSFFELEELTETFFPLLGYGVPDEADII